MLRIRGPGKYLRWPKSEFSFVWNSGDLLKDKAEWKDGGGSGNLLKVGISAMNISQKNFTGFGEGQADLFSGLATVRENRWRAVFLLWDTTAAKPVLRPCFIYAFVYL